MARRRTKKKSRRRKSGISALGLLETVMLMNVVTETVFNNSLWGFFTNQQIKGAGQTHSNIVTIGEIFTPTAGVGASAAASWGTAQNLGGVISRNFRVNWMKGATGMILIPISFRVGKALARPAISKTNQLLNKAGVGSTIKL